MINWKQVKSGVLGDVKETMFKCGVLLALTAPNSHYLLMDDSIRKLIQF